MKDKDKSPNDKLESPWFLFCCIRTHKKGKVYRTSFIKAQHTLFHISKTHCYLQFFSFNIRANVKIPQFTCISVTVYKPNANSYFHKLIFKLFVDDKEVVVTNYKKGTILKLLVIIKIIAKLNIFVDNCIDAFIPYILMISKNI